MQEDKSRLVIEERAYPLDFDLLGSKRWSLRISLIILAFLYLYVPVLGKLAETWWLRDDYSHGFLVPFISLYLIWYQRERLKPLQLQPAFLSGISVVMTAGMMLLLGEAGGVITLQELSLVVMIVGLVLCLLGKDYLRVLGFPIAYLLFMIPITDEIINPLHWTFQLMTAKMGVGLLQTLGFAVHLEDQYILLPTITLEVAKACSGINYLISIIAIGIPLAYVTQKNVWCRVILVVSAVIIGVMANWIRVAAIGIWAYYGGKVLHGPFHVFQALFIAQLGFIALFAGAWILSKVPPSPSKAVTFGFPHTDHPQKNHLGTQHRVLNRSWLGAFLILMGLVAYLSFHERVPVPLKVELALFPLSIGDWRGQEVNTQKAVFRVQGADHELVRIYSSPSGDEIQLYVAYFESQHHSKELVNHLTAPLHRNAAVVDVPLEGQKAITVNQTQIRNERGEQRAFFWYDLNDKTVANRYQAKLVTTLGALTHGQTNGAFVLVAAVLKDQNSAEDLQQEEAAFIRELVPVLRRYLP